MSIAAIPGVAEVVVVAGAARPPAAAPRLLIEVPHGADHAAHFHACCARLQGALPADLIDFFHANTDEGAWDVARATAKAAVERDPGLAVLLIRCLIPRTLIDCNRVLGGDVEAAGGGVTAGLPVYIENVDDQGVLRKLHAQYCALVDAACAAVVGEGGLVLVPHTYAPRSVGIARVERDIVERMHWAWHPDRATTWPLRPEVDLITRDGEGTRLSPPGVAEDAAAALGEAGLEVQEGGTYWLHPATRAAALSARHPGRLFCLELRRDLVMQDWTPFAPCQPASVVVDAVGRALAGALVAGLARTEVPRGKDGAMGD